MIDYARICGLLMILTKVILEIGCDVNYLVGYACQQAKAEN